MNDTKTPRTITESVTLTDLNTALQPLYDLLGLDTGDIYAHPGITIEHDGGISFTVPADGSVVAPSSLAQRRLTVGDAPCVESAIAVTVEIRGVA